MKILHALGLLLAVFCTSANAANHVVKVEESWELSVGEPNDSRNAPQVTMAMSPSESLNSDYFVYELNHKTQPNYSAGGMQVQRWFNDKHESTYQGPQTAELSTTGEVVSWTQSLSVENGKVTFDVIDGQSQTWGSFGNASHLRATAVTGQQNLDSYRANISISESGIGYAGNRVASLILKRIRWTMDDGKTYELNAPIDIDTDLDPWNVEEEDE